MNKKTLEVQRTFYDAKDKGFNQALTQFWKNYYLFKLNKGDLDSAIMGLQALREEIRDNEDSKSADWTLITINPYLHIKMSEFKLVVEKLISKKWITTYTYTYEQRSETNEQYKGFHCHLLLYRKDKCNSSMYREIRNTCKAICDTSNTHILNFRHLRTDEDVKKAYNYITAQKADSNKHIKQMIDKEFRNFYYLKSFYKKDPDNLISDLIKCQESMPDHFVPEKDPQKSEGLIPKK